MTMVEPTWRAHPTGNGGWELVHVTSGEVRPVVLSQYRHRLRVELRNAVNHQPFHAPDLAVYEAEVLAPLKRRLTEATENDIANTRAGKIP